MSELFPFPADEFMLVGKVAKAHGLKGELKVTHLSGRPELFLNYSRLALIAKDGRMTASLEIEKYRIQGRQVILKLATIDTKSEADLTSGMGVIVPRKDLTASASEELNPLTLEGVEVWDAVKDRSIGIVKGFFSNGAQEILIVSSGSDEFLIPLVQQFIVSRTSERITINPPDGLLEANSESDL